MTHILEHDFLEEQVQAIYEIGLYVTRLRKFAPPNRAKVATSNYKLGEYLFDQKLHKSLDEKEPEGPPKRNYGKMA
ncbi:hypothetical protein RRG08_063207 [Elysia crispata]|uniref:Ferritin-like diiron domain-containing protein n=1 Tax=Elysia crispata TaxID=231223 RepID=A0AAE1B679_9GAST|nr:hypothetical protein RRG08_063207 [Elysia crispata]